MAIKGTTTAGFEFEVNENIGKDFGIVVAMKKLNCAGDLQKIEGTYEFVNAVLGEDGIDRIMDFARAEKGYADTQFILEQTKEIVEYANEHNAEVKK